MFTKLRKAQSGFTIVELLIVIVVIGILAALVLNTFQGVQARARDTERKTDINAIHTHLEVYYNDNGNYPVNAAAITVANLPGLDAEALVDPNGGSIGDCADATDTAQYCYSVSPAACDNSATACDGYTLRGYQETDTANDYTKSSLN